MKRTVYLLLFTLVFAVSTAAQEPAITIVWKDSINSVLSYLPQRAFVALQDSSTVFVTRRYNRNAFEPKFGLAKKMQLVLPFD